TTPITPDASLSLLKTAGTPSGNAVGDTIAYSFLVTNTGNVTIGDLVVSDPLLAVAPVCPVTTLAPGASTTCTGSYTLTQADIDNGEVVNSATAGGTPPASPGNPAPPPVDTPPSTTTTPITPDASLSLLKTAGTPSGNAVGDTIAYSFLVTNTGNVTIGDLVVSDPLLAVAPVCPVTTLAPGASTTCTGSYTLTQADIDNGEVVNSATAGGTPPASPGNPAP